MTKEPSLCHLGLFKEEKMTDKTNIITRAGLEEISDWLVKVLEEYKVSSKEFLFAELLVEEVFNQLELVSENKEDFSSQIRVRNFLGSVSIEISAQGGRGVSLDHVYELSEDDENYTSSFIINAYRKQLRSYRINRKNIVVIKLHESEMKRTKMTMAGLVTGAVLGTVLKAYASPVQTAWIEDNILSMIQIIFLNALVLVAVPQIFFSIMSGITNIGASGSFVRVGRKLVLYSVPKMGLYVIIGMLTGHLLGGISQIPGMIAKDQAIDNQNVLRDMLVNIVPGDVITPFYTRNVLQLLVLACVSGVILSRAGSWAKWGKDGINFFNNFLWALMDIILPFIPLAVMVSTAKLVMHTGLESVIAYGKVIIASAMGVPIAIIISGLMILIAGKISPLPFVSKIVKFIPLPFSLSNSTACMPAVMAFCQKKLGINEKLAGVSIPLGMQLNMDGTAYYVAIVSMVLVHTFNIETDISFMLSFFTVLLLVDFTGMGLVAMPSIYAGFGIPEIGVAMMIGIEPILDMFGTAQSVIGNITASFLTGRDEKDVDVSIYKE